MAFSSSLVQPSARPLPPIRFPGGRSTRRPTPANLARKGLQRPPSQWIHRLSRFELNPLKRPHLLHRVGFGAGGEPALLAQLIFRPVQNLAVRDLLPTQIQADAAARERACGRGCKSAIAQSDIDRHMLQNVSRFRAVAHKARPFATPHAKRLHTALQGHAGACRLPSARSNVM
jgi:hypothetical protein